SNPPIRSIELGSGAGLWGPGPKSPAVVPNENVAVSILSLAVRPEIAMSKVTVPARNGLCGLLPAMEALALEYTLEAFGLPIIVWAGVLAAPASPVSSHVLPAVSAQPVLTDMPSVNVPPLATVRSRPE